MESLTKEEQALVQKSCGEESSRTRVKMWSKMYFVATCFSAGLIIEGATSQLVGKEITWSQFLHLIGFAIMLTTLIGLLWILNHHDCVAQSTISKLYRESHCVKCGDNLSVDGTPNG